MRDHRRRPKFKSNNKRNSSKKKKKTLLIFICGCLKRQEVALLCALQGKEARNSSFCVKLNIFSQTETLLMRLVKC